MFLGTKQEISTEYEDILNKGLQRQQDTNKNAEIRDTYMSRLSLTNPLSKDAVPTSARTPNQPKLVKIQSEPVSKNLLEQPAEVSPFRRS